MTDSKFVAGAAVYINLHETWHLTKVLKIYKTGRFVIEGDSKQWVPLTSDSIRARKCGGHSGSYLHLVTPETTAMIEAHNARVLMIRQRKQAIDQITDFAHFYRNRVEQLSDDMAARLLMLAQDIRAFKKSVTDGQQ